MSKMTRIAIILLVMGAVAIAQSTEQSPQPSSAPKAASPEASVPAARPDPGHQMQLDLDQMESLLNNMTAQVNFIRDTNMSILLQTNVRLWSVLIRDLRMQLDAQQRERAAPAAPPHP